MAYNLCTSNTPFGPLRRLNEIHYLTSYLAISLFKNDSKKLKLNLVYKNIDWKFQFGT